jgi:hypothetical protein
MKARKTTIKGLTFNVLIEEINDRDAVGGLICYLASVYLIDRRTSARRLIRRSRIPGIADTLCRELQRDGIQAFRRLAKG